MAVVKVILAKLSPTMEEGTIVKWSKNEGDAVKSGDVLAEIETDKANMEMEALGSGVLRKILVPAGGKAPVGALIGVIAGADEDISKLLAANPSAPTAPPTSEPVATQTPSSTPSAAPPAESRPPAAGVPTPSPAQAQPQPQANATQPKAPEPATSAAVAGPSPAPPTGDGGRVKASPLARSMAAQQNIPLGSVSGSGPGGRIIKRDIEAWSQTGQAAPAAAAAAAAAPAAAPAVTPGQEIALSGMRKTIARRLSESKVQSPHFYVTVEIAMEGASALREQVQKAEETKVSYNDIIVKACAKALRKFPAVNASWQGESIAVHGDVNIGVAVAINDGLIVPVVRNADRKSLLEVSREVKELAGRARERRLKPEEFSGGTFSISNLGMYDVTAFTAIINPPESAILAVGAVREVPVVKDGALAVGLRMQVTLSSDHRVIDGALAAQFLAELRRLLENPVSIFV